jgi:GNAT superfamily N-acetyltransferase
MHQLEFTKNPTAKEMETLTLGISKNAEEKKGLSLHVEPFGFFHKDSQGIILAGCHGEMCYESMYISQLWVSKELRHQGLGTLLMQKAESLAKDSGCHLIAINTMDWEAELFYKKLGFKVDFVRSGYEKDSKMLFLSKKI